MAYLMTSEGSPLRAVAAAAKDVFQRTVLVDLTAPAASSLRTRPARSRPAPAPAATTATEARLYEITADGAVEYSLDPASLRINFGKTTKPGATTIQVNEAGLDADQALLLRVDNNWLLLDRGRDDRLTVNGMPTRQRVLNDYDTALIGIGSTYFIYCGPKSGGLPKHDQAAPRLMDEVVGADRRAFAVRWDEQRAHSNGRPLLIGQSPVCDIEIDHANVAPLHAVVCPSPDGVVVIPIVANSVQASGTSFSAPMPLAPGYTTVNLGLRSFPAPTFMMQLEVVAGADLACAEAARRRRRYARFCLAAIQDTTADDVCMRMDGQPLFVGRGDGCAVPLRDTRLSRRHAELVPNSKYLTVKDLGSGNGTYINDRRIDVAVARAGDLVQFGSSQFVLIYA